MISLDRCNGICNTIDDPSTKMFIPSKTGGVNAKIFNVIKNK